MFCDTLRFNSIIPSALAALTFLHPALRGIKWAMIISVGHKVGLAKLSQTYKGFVHSSNFLRARNKLTM